MNLSERVHAEAIQISDDVRNRGTITRLEDIPDLLASLARSVDNEVKKPLNRAADEIQYLKNLTTSMEHRITNIVKTHDRFVDDLLRRQRALEDHVDKLTRIIEVSLEIKEEKLRERGA